MSDYYINFIPEDVNTMLTVNEIRKIRELPWRNNKLKVTVGDIVKFCDAGSNFQTVKCPFCRSDLMDEWGESMNKAYYDEKGFVDLDFLTPCCNKITTLQNLDHDFPQGFYRSIIEVEPELQHTLNIEVLLRQLMQITNKKWRVIHSHF